MESFIRKRPQIGKVSQKQVKEEMTSHKCKNNYWQSRAEEFCQTLKKLFVSIKIILKGIRHRHTLRKFQGQYENL